MGTPTSRTNCFPQPYMSSTTEEIKKQAGDAAKNSVIDSAVDKAGEAISPFIEKLKPVFNVVHEAVVKVEPYIELAVVKGHEFYTKIEPYHPDELFSVFIGFVLCFYGGAFCTTIAAVEAFRFCGLDRTTKAFSTLRDQYKMAETQLKKDDTVDADSDGIKDNQQRSTDQVVKRKMKIALKTCDPEALSDGLTGLYSGLLAVIATLQLRFAQVLTLGASLGDGLERFATKGIPMLEQAVEPEFKKWIPQAVSYLCKMIGVMLAWMVQRVIFGFTSAVKGGQMLCRGLSSYLVRHGHIDKSLVAEGSSTFNYIEMVVSAIGFYAQFSRGFSSLGWMAIPLFPLSCFEFTLGMVVGKVA